MLHCNTENEAHYMRSLLMLGLSPVPIPESLDRAWPPPSLILWSWQAGSQHLCPASLYRSGLGLGVEALWPAQLKEKSLSINSLKRLRQAGLDQFLHGYIIPAMFFSHVHLIQSNSQEEEQLLCCGLLRAASNLCSLMWWLLKQEESRMKRRKAEKVVLA